MTAASEAGVTDRTEALLWSVPTGPLPVPPADTRGQVLPVGDLHWADAERLFLRLLHTVCPVQYAKLFGTPGQAQAGIDAYARLPLNLSHGESGGRGYITLQSRRVKTLTAARITKAVDDFLEGEWAQRTARFYFATSFDLQNTRLDTAIRKQTERLAELKIAFVPWGAQEVSRLLKDQPRLVDDFFGRPWVERFCGPDAAQGLAHNLPHHDITQLRAELRDLYRAVFSAQGGAQPAEAAEPDSAFVVLDVDPSHLRPDRLDAGQPEPVVEEQRPQENPFDAHTSGVTQLGSSRPSFRSARQLLGHHEQARPVGAVAADEWLAGGRLRLLVGRPGAGKSSLLRFVAADLLSARPQSIPLQREHGTDLPVWLPFGYLCRHLQASTENSLLSAAKAWLTSQSAAHLWPLVRRALRDDRLLLLIDGIDEWSDVNAAERALGTIEAFLGHARASAILTTRPYAVDRLNWRLPWAHAEVAPLTGRQRRTIAAAILAAAAQPHDTTAVPVMWSAGVDAFLAQLETIPELAELSRSPLFLTLLATAWQGEPLPRQRFKIYARLVELLVEKHPQMRQRASHAQGAMLPAAEVTTLFAAVAYRLRVKDPTATVTKAQMRTLIVESMTDDEVLGYPRQEARRVADAVLAMAEDEFGLIVSHGAGSVGFLHRVVLDHLAGQYLATRPAEEQIAVLQQSVPDPAWRDVLLALLSVQISSHTTEPLLAAAISTGSGRWADIDGYELLADALAAGVTLTPRAQTLYIDRLVERVESHPALLHRAHLITSLTGMLAGRALRTRLLPVMKRWLTAPRPDPTPVMWTLRDLDIDDDSAAGYLLWGMRHPEDQVKINAAAAIAHRFGGRTPMLHQLITLTETGPSSTVQAAALFSLGNGWPDASETAQLADWARHQPSSPLRLVALHILQRATTPGDAVAFRPEERDWLLSMLHREHFHAGPWPLADLIKTAAATDAGAADFVLQTLKTNGRNGGDRGLAWTLACTVFADDDRFKTWSATQLSGPDRHALILYDVSMIPRQWRDDPEFAQALRPYAERELKDVRSYYAAGLATALPPDHARAALLGGLDGYRPYVAARTLAERYADDEQVRHALAGRLRADFAQAAPMAGVAVDVLGPQQGFAVLVSLLRRPAANHSTEEHVVVAEALAEAWKQFEQAGAGDDADGAAAREILARYDPAELAALCTAVDPHPLTWHVPAVISAWPGQPAAQDFADKLIHDTRLLMAGVADVIPAAILRAYANRTDAPSRRILDKTLNLFKHLAPELREVLAFELARSPLSATELIDVMEGWKDDPDSEVRRTALIGLTQVIMRHQQARNELTGSHTLIAAMEWLRAEIRGELCAYGPELEERRQLAWIGMLMLHDPTLIDGIRETIGDPNEPGVTLDVPYSDDADPVLVDLVAANWDALSAHFGDTLLARLNGKHDRRQGTQTKQRSHVLSALATVASRYPAIAEILRKESDDDAALRHDERFLLWAKEENRGGEGALRAFVTSLGRTHHLRQNQILDSLLDRDSWKVSDELFKAVLTEEADGQADALAVYAQLFPSDSLSIAALHDLERWFAADPQTRGRREWSDSLAITFGAALPQDLPALAARAHTRLRTDSLDRRLPMFTRPLLRRLRVDEDAVEAFKDALSHPMNIREDSPLLAASWDPITDAHPELQPVHRRYLFAVVLRVAGALPQADAAEVIRLLESASPDTVVHNPFTGFESPLRLAVLDLAAAR